jgi:hypothetical protein
MKGIPEDLVSGERCGVRERWSQLGKHPPPLSGDEDAAIVRYELA